MTRAVLLALAAAATIAALLVLATIVQTVVDGTAATLSILNKGA